MSESQRIQELEKEVKRLEEVIKQLKNSDINVDSLSGTFFGVDIITKEIRIIQTKAPEKYKTPEIKTELTKTAYYNNTYSKALLPSFIFPGTKNIIFRGKYAIKPDSLEGKVIMFLLDEQERMEGENKEHKERFFKITNMATMDEAIEHVKRSK
ncbi:MAG: hypothetical protein HRU07_03315 [Nitrosopumilus sp.]|nr:hypothetical protein [Nitrosopumilus sp.]NRA05190.1 hypothetical protein [Nitrosopumilus sp.]